MPVFRWLRAGDMVKCVVADELGRVVSDPGMWQGHIAGGGDQNMGRVGAMSYNPYTDDASFYNFIREE
jgi:hypothetical protein